MMMSKNLMRRSRSRILHYAQSQENWRRGRQFIFSDSLFENYNLSTLAEGKAELTAAGFKSKEITQAIFLIFSEFLTTMSI